VGRIRKEKPVRLPEPDLVLKTSYEKPRSLKASRPNHVWIADLTEIPSLFGLFSFKLAVVYDVFSRMPLAASLFPGEPSAAAIACLFSRASRRFGRARHFVSDQGSQFTATVFRETLTRLAVRHPLRRHRQDRLDRSHRALLADPQAEARSQDPQASRRG
jgi:transposase InsO family protein